MLNNDVRDWELFTVDSIRETRAQVNENTKRLEAMEQRLAALECGEEPGPEPVEGDGDGQ